MPRIASALAALPFALAGCFGSGPDLQRGDETDPVLAAEGSCDGAPDDPLSLSKLDVAGTRLRATVSYGGGCETHVFAACWTIPPIQSLFPEFDLVLHHDANDDACDAVVTRDVVIDLSALGLPIRSASVADPRGAITLVGG